MEEASEASLPDRVWDATVNVRVSAMILLHSRLRQIHRRLLTVSAAARAPGRCSCHTGTGPSLHFKQTVPLCIAWTPAPS